MSARVLTFLVVAITVLAVTFVIVSGASAARPSQHTAVVRANYAVERLCGGGWVTCVKRYPVNIFYNCGSNAKCWNVCYTHVERLIFSSHRSFKCSTGKISYRAGFLTYYFEY